MKTSTILLHNTFLSFGTNLLSKVANVFTFILVARASGTADAGIFSLAITYLLIFTAITWGLDELMIRQIARDRSTASQYFFSFLALRLLLAILLYILFAVIVLVGIEYDPSTAAPILILCLSLIPDSLGYVGQGVLAAHENLKAPFIASLVSSSIKLTGVVVSLIADLGLIGIGWAWFLGSCIGAIIVLLAAYRQAGSSSTFQWMNKGFWLERLKLALPFLSIGILITLEYQLDVVILSATVGETEVGLYGAATTILFSLVLIPQAFRVAIYPLMTRYHYSEPSKLVHLYRASFFFLGALALPIAVGITILSEPIVLLIFGEAFTGAIQPLRIIIWSILFLYLNVPNSRLMLVHDRQLLLSTLLTFTMVLNILLNLLLNPTLGAVGAASARLISAIAFFIPSYLYVIKFLIPYNVIKDLTRSLIAVLLMSVIVWVLRDQPLWYPILIGAATYIISIIIIKGIPEYGERMLFNALQQLQKKF